MATSPYNVQQLAIQAYGWINATGATAAGFNCSMSRVTTGLYQLTLGASDGVLEGQSWIVASPVLNAVSNTARVVTPVYVSNTVRTFQATDAATPTNTDTDIEVIVFKTSINISGV
jgi:hypothetical protein